MLSWKNLQEENVILQRLDYSCGAAGLATLMTYYFRDNVTEYNVLSKILSKMSREELQDRVNNGLSLLDLKRASEEMGYQAIVVKLKYEGLQQLMGPILIHMEHYGYQHFVVLRGVKGNMVFLADPSRGNMRLPLSQFAKEWTGAALILGKAGFGLPLEYPLALKEWEENQNQFLPVRSALYLPH